MNKKALVSVLIFLLMPILTLPVQVGANVSSDPAPTASVMGYSVDSDGNGDFYEIDLTTGVANLVGPLPVGLTDLEGLAFDPNTGVLYGVDDGTNKLCTIDPSDGMATEVGDLGVSIIDIGLTIDPDGNLWMSSDLPTNFYSVDKTTGAATLIGDMGQEVTALAAASDGTIYGLGGDYTDNLVTIDTATGVATPVGPLNTVSLEDGGLDFDANGVLWGIEDQGTVFTINTLTGEALLIRNMAVIGFESLAIPKPLPPPPDVYQYNFRLNPYVDVFHLNISDCGWIEGIVTTASYTEPLLGRYELGYAVIAWDLPAGGIEMGFAAIKASSGAGSMMRILDDLSVVGPETVWLTWAVTASAAPAVAGVAMDDVAGLAVSVANEEPTLELQMNPFDDVINLYTDDEAWLWGWADAVGPSYPAPLLGVYGYDRFFYAMDYVDGTGLHELAFAAGSTCSLRGSIVRSPRGFSEGATPIWLTEP